MEMCVMVRKGKGVRHFQTEYPLTDGGGLIISIIRACPLLSLLAQHTLGQREVCLGHYGGTPLGASKGVRLLRGMGLLSAAVVPRGYLDRRVAPLGRGHK